jgi:hypothetical protein
LPGLDTYRETVRQITRDSNETLFRVMEDMADSYTDGKQQIWTADLLRACSRRHLKNLLKNRNAFVYGHQDILLDALRESAAVRVSA